MCGLAQLTIFIAIGHATALNSNSVLSFFNPGSPTSQNVHVRPKVPPIRPRPGNSHFRQPMIALGSPTANQFRPAISMIQTPQGPVGIMHSPQATLNTPTFPVALTGQPVTARPLTHGQPRNQQATQAKYPQGLFCALLPF